MIVFCLEVDHNNVRVKFDKNMRNMWIENVLSNARAVLTDGMLGSHSGRKYPNLPRRSSTPGEYPASQSGRVLSSLKTEQSAREGTIGTGAKHSIFLRKGTSNMRRRKMSDDALKEGRRAAGMIKAIKMEIY